MPVAKKSVKKVASTSAAGASSLAGSGMSEMAQNIAVSLLDKNKDGNIKDDLLTMAINFIKTKFMKK
jgi:hypothetical protein